MIDIEGEEKRVVRMQTRPRSNLDILLQTFIRLDGDLTIIGDEEPYLFPVCQETIPSAFYSLEEAMVHLDTIATAAHGICRNIVIMADKMITCDRPELEAMDADMRNCLACAYSRMIPIDEEQEARLEKIKTDMNAWMPALAFLPVTQAQESAQLLTQIHFFYTWFTVLSWRDENEMLVDRFDGQFDHILTLAERYVKIHGSFLSPDGTDSRSASSALTRQAFTVGTDLVTCINMIGFKSRNGKVRRRCVRLLQTINLAGVFDGHYLAAFTQTVIDLEERKARAINGLPPDVDLLCHQVPEEARLVEIELSPISHMVEEKSFYKKDSGRLIYVYFKDLDTRELDVSQEIFSVQRPMSAAKGATCPHWCGEWDDAFADFGEKFPTT
ncbi:hypothetical protein Slin15195_G057490 [Septoria linicola]|uniref:Uncharacterized protein n=1 Tax=Septoria linicola TaxID=215465 RepID=A0A9Q9ANY0_9PEZI|nr:hypothetical protein Slin14017_G073340 [Septoria linicola]USW52430.1 hypothetical protein Slin15195_G057490 [Septoria linicola]